VTGREEVEEDAESAPDSNQEEDDWDQGLWTEREIEIGRESMKRWRGLGRREWEAQDHFEIKDSESFVPEEWVVIG
jgi:hypothetical protein